MSVRHVQHLCADGKIEGATKFGNAWAIPENAVKPQDNRVTSGNYKNWRKKSVSEQVSAEQRIDTAGYHVVGIIPKLLGAPVSEVNPQSQTKTLGVFV